MKIAFTLCSLNYIAQAKTLATSFKKHNPDWHFVIGLVDKINGRLSESYWQPAELLEVGELSIDGFEEMYQNYNIIELNTAVKPFYMDYLFKRDSSVDIVAYFDPDIMFFEKIDDLEEKIRKSPIVLTPHFFKPTSRKFERLEILCLGVGVYNLGFIALKRNEQSFTFLDWWMERLRYYCKIQQDASLFVDQKWIDFAPIFYEKIELLHEGHNVAYWNLQERIVSEREKRYWVNQTYPLVFFHFSSYNPLMPNKISKEWDWLFSFENYKELSPVFEEYRVALLNNNYENLKKERCVYYPLKKEGIIKKTLKNIRSLLPNKARNMMRKGLEFGYKHI
jgi:hypothetical protein